MLYLHWKVAWLTKDNQIRRHPYRCLVSSPMSPKSVLKSIAPILLVGLHNLLQDPLDFSIWDPGLPISLRVIWCRKLVHNPILLKQNPHGSITKMGALVTNDSFRNSKPAKYVRPNKVHNNSSIISSNGFGFHPFWNIINNKQDVSKTKTITLTLTTLANPSSTQGFLVFNRHPEPNSRDVIPSSIRGMPHA